jgi:hypothetical protein
VELECGRAQKEERIRELIPVEISVDLCRCETLSSGVKKRDRGCFENKALRRICAFRRYIARKKKELHDF